MVPSSGGIAAWELYEPNVERLPVDRSRMNNTSNFSTPVPSLSSDILPKPLLRGWLHAAAAVAGLVVAVVLCQRSLEDPPRAVSMVVYGLCMAELFGVSAAYHIGSWHPRVGVRLRAVDHAGIFVFIAGLYTPYVVNLLDGWARPAILIGIWLQALLGVVFIGGTLRLPRWAYTALYFTTGWAAVVIVPHLVAVLPLIAIALLFLTVFLYGCGALVYALQRPDPWPRIFGFHEVFHGLVVAAVLVNTLVVWVWVGLEPHA
jgi:hemolysin III